MLRAIEKTKPGLWLAALTRALNVLSWSVFLIALFSFVPVIDGIISLQTLLAAKCASLVVLAGLHPSCEMPWVLAVERVLLRWLSLTVGMIGLYWFDLVQPVGPSMLHVLCGLGQVLFQSLFSIARSYLGRHAWMGDLHLPILAAAVLIGSLHSQVSAGYVLLSSLFILALLSTRTLAEQFLITARRGPPIGFFLEGGLVSLRYIDVLLLPWVLSPGWAVTYLLARGLSEVICLGLNGLQQKALPALSRAKRPEEKRALAARLNLGMLLIGGALAVAAFGVGRIAPLVPWLGSAGVPQIMPWLVSSAAGPAIFGATGLLLPQFGGLGLLSASAWMGVLLFCVGAAAFPIRTALDLAVLYASAALTHHLSCAVALGVKSGIWPGVTALLFRQIRVRQGAPSGR